MYSLKNGRVAQFKVFSGFFKVFRQIPLVFFAGLFFNHPVDCVFPVF